MLWLVRDSCYLTFGLLSTLSQFFLDYINPFKPRVPRLDDLSDLAYLSEAINQQVVKIEDESGEVGLGGGGTGTARRTLTAWLANGKKLHLFIKTPATTLMERVFLTFFKVYDTELYFYKHFKNEYAEKLNCGEDEWKPFPEVHCCRIQGRGNFLLIIEDVRFREDPAIFKDILQGVDTPALQAVCRAFVRQHVSFWRNPPTTVWGFSPETGNPNRNTPPVVRLLIEGGFYSVMRKYKQKLRLTADVEKTLHLALENYSKLRKFWSQAPLTLCHGDSHMGNVFFNSSMAKVGFVDFQCLAAEHCLRDVSYHLLMSYSTEVLPGIEESTIKYYLEELHKGMLSRKKLEFVKDIPSFEEAHFMYRTYAIWVLIAWVICCGFADYVMEKFALESLQRIFDNAARLNTLEALQKVLADEVPFRRLK